MRRLFLFPCVTAFVASCVMHTSPGPQGPEPQAQPGQPGPTATAVMQPQATSTMVAQPQATATPVMQTSGAGQYTTSNFGTITLAANFQPDPHVVQGTSGGQQDASNRGSGCTGWIAGTPDHLLVVNGYIPNLRVMASSGVDVTLVIQGPDGSYRCDDDSGGDRNPMVTGSFGAGQYAVWLGSYRQGEDAQYRLGFSELNSVTAASLGSPAGTTNAVNTSVASTFGTVSLRAGFTPDPHVVSGRSGGGRNAEAIASGCNGWVATQPDHIFVANSSFSRLKILAKSNDDTTLVIQRPDGSYACNDDAEGRDPIVDGFFGQGTYRVWVGSYRQGAVAEYQLGFTEMSGVTPSSLASGGSSGGGNMGGTFPSISLSSGFTPDPHTVQGTSGGERNAQTVHSQCRGWIADRPDHIFQAQTSFRQLRVIAQSEQDTTLVIQRPNGSYLCDDDSEGRDPVLSGRFEAGTYRVWIGSYEHGVRSPYNLSFTELTSR